MASQQQRKKELDLCRGKQYPIMGCSVSFPESKKPFPAQLAVMSKVIQALKTRQHALLESPTGSGKTLALLCSSLSWQASEIETLRNNETENAKDASSNPFGEFEASTTSTESKKRVLPDMMLGPNKELKYDNEKVDEKLENLRQKTPRIFFASRTHSQLEQIIGEFRRCPDTFVKVPSKIGLHMTILGSRRHMCINPDVRNSDDIDDMCRDLMRREGGDSCQYKPNPNARDNLGTLMPPVWDIEDLVKYGTQHKACPYFHAREKDQANIVFCPYNYLLDPRIRTAMEINLNEAVIVLDEAHNIEDVCREAASVEISLETLNECVDQLSTALDYGVIDEYVRIRQILQVSI